MSSEPGTLGPARTTTQWFFLAHRPEFGARFYLFLPLFSTYSGPLQICYFVFISKFLTKVFPLFCFLLLKRR